MLIVSSHRPKRLAQCELTLTRSVAYQCGLKSAIKAFRSPFIADVDASVHVSHHGNRYISISNDPCLLSYIFRTFTNISKEKTHFTAFYRMCFS